MRHVIFLLLLLNACTAKEQKPKVKESKISPSDTFVKKYIYTPNKTLENKVQTLELQYIGWGCACPEWITPADYEKYQENKLAEHCIFIEPADSTLYQPENDSTFGNNGKLIRVEGQFYTVKDYPKGTFETEEHLDKAKVFRYTEIKVIK